MINLIIYFLLFIILLLIANYSNKFSYLFITVLFFGIIIYYLNFNKIVRTNITDNNLVNLINSIDFLNNNHKIELIEEVNYFLFLYHTAYSIKNNTQFTISDLEDISDQLEKIMKLLESYIYELPLSFMHKYYDFSQQLRIKLSKYYYDLIKEFDMNDVKSFNLLHNTLLHDFSFVKYYQ